MKLSDASRYFDQIIAIDPITGMVLFTGQIDPFDESRRDSSTSYRRTLSVKPGTVMPASRTVRMLGRVWMIGAMEPDGMLELHREKYVIQHAPVQMKVSRLSEFLAGTVAATSFASANWVKDEKDLATTSTTPQVFDVTLPLGTDARAYDVLWGSGYAYLVLSPHDLASGLFNAHCLKLDHVLPEAATISTRTYSPTTGTYTASAPTAINALRVVWQNLFQYESQMSERYQEGDIAIALPTGTVATTSTLITIGGVTYQTLAVPAVSGAVVLHARVV